MNAQERQDLYCELLARHRNELYGYIFAVVRTWEDADDLFQTVCTILWSKFESFQPGTDFFAWARQVAKNQISKFLNRKRQPDFINEELLDALTAIAIDAESDLTESYLEALRRCKTKLAVHDEQLLELHYGEGFGTTQIADKLHRNRTSVCRALNRIRCWLFECIQVEVARQEHPRAEHS